MGNLQEILAAAGVATAPSVESLHRLTPRQRDVLAMLCEGLPNKLIARRLNISNGTVKVHIVHILRTLKVANRVQAVLAAHSLGFNPGGSEPAAMTSPLLFTPPSRILSIPQRVKVQRQEPPSLLATLMSKRLDVVN